VLLGYIVPVAVACGAKPESETTNELDPARRSRLNLETLPPMPSYPDSVAGHLVAVSAGDFPIAGRWSAAAWACPSAGTIELYTDDLQNGMGMVLHFPDAQAVGTYIVSPPDSGRDEERVARIGVQVFRDMRSEAFGFHAVDGKVEISEVGDHLSGKFQATLSETQIEILTQYVGVLFRIPLKDLPEEYCSVLRDSLRVPTTLSDTVVAGSGERVTGS